LRPSAAVSLDRPLELDAVAFRIGEIDRRPRPFGAVARFSSPQATPLRREVARQMAAASNGAMRRQAMIEIGAAIWNFPAPDPARRPASMSDQRPARRA
jgi:hypothetical protein